MTDVNPEIVENIIEDAIESSAVTSSSMGMLRKLFGQQPNPIFIPRQHTKLTYAAQNRAAKKRRKQK